MKPESIAFLRQIGTPEEAGDDPDAMTTGFLITVALAAAAIFCFARLRGAHL